MFLLSVSWRRTLLVVGLATCAVMQATAAQSHLTILYSFTGGNDGEAPAAGLIRDEAGNLYGTTLAGGNSGCGGIGCGIVFKLAPNGVETVLHAFTGGNDGANPWSSLIMDKAGNLYGTSSGRNGNVNSPGTVFRIAPDGTESVLHVFGGADDGLYPSSSLLMDRRGNLYGTTPAGGNYGAGVLFKVATDGRESILWSFGGPGDGAAPSGPLLQDAAGNFYGTTTFGGPGNLDCDSGCGTIFEFTPNVRETVLYAFGATQGDGEYPVAGLAVDKQGNFYGVTDGGGSATYGTVYRFSKGGTEQPLYSFDSITEPMAGVTLDGNGYLYGTTSLVPHGDGSVYRLKVDGTEFTTVHTFGGHPGGIFPYSDVYIRGGMIYGTTFAGGDRCPFESCGVVYALKK